jgi:hypothetical protein
VSTEVTTQTERRKGRADKPRPHEARSQLERLPVEVVRFFGASAAANGRTGTSQSERGRGKEGESGCGLGECRSEPVVELPVVGSDLKSGSEAVLSEGELL